MNANDSPRQNPDTFLIFVLGGVTPVEVQRAYAISQESGLNVLIGGTTILSPTQFMNEIASISDTDSTG